jgi:DNA end-binding protein Ku
MAKSKITRPRERASWRGMLRFGLVAFPVQAFNALYPQQGHVSFHQLHAKCHSRIRYEKTCPIHGPVDNSEIVSGYEYARGKYVEISDEELDDLRTEKEKSLTIDNFVQPEEVDPIYYDGRMYYLAPQGDQALEPYAVFLAALAKQGRVGVGTVVFSGREHVALVRPMEQVLHLAMLNYKNEVKTPHDAAVPLPTIRNSDKKVKLAEQLIESMVEGSFDLEHYVDTYEEKVEEFITAKLEDREVVKPSAEEPAEVINLMDALRKSVAGKTHKAASPAARHGPHKRTRASKRKPRRAS